MTRTSKRSLLRLQVRRTLSETRTGRKFELRKSGNGHSIKLSRKAVEALRGHRARQRRSCGWALCGRKTASCSRPQQTAASGTNLLGRHFKPLMKKAGLLTIRLHDLRHTCATILFMAGKHTKFVQEMFGHANISITLDTYSHAIEIMDGGLGDAMDEAL